MREGGGGFRDAGLRPGQLLVLLGLTGFAVSQPLLSVAGDSPSMFVFAGVRGWGMVVFALVVALVPPLVLWAALVLIGLVDRRAGDIAFVVCSAALAGAAAIQWAKSAGFERGVVLAAAGGLGALAFAALLVFVRPVALWSRFTAVLPAAAVVLLLVASPAGDLLRSPATAAGSAGGGGDLPSVVFVMFDEFALKSVLAEDGTIDAVRFPNLAALAGQSTWYRNYTVMANQTKDSIPSILSGRRPDGGAPLWTAHPDNLFSLLAPTHDLTVSETATQLCGFSNCGIEGAQHSDRGGLRSVLSEMADVWRERVALRPVGEVDIGQFAEEAEPLDPDRDGGPGTGTGAGRDELSARPGRATDFMEALGTARSPSLNYLHLMLPHQPWSYYPDGQRYRGVNAVDFAAFGARADDWSMAMLEQAHLFQAQYADRLLGEITDRLRSEGLFDESLVVVTADHGLSFDQEGFPDLRQGYPESLDGNAYVPLLVKRPAQRDGRVDEENLMAVDLLPTIAAAVGVDLPWEVDGYAAGSAEISARGDGKVLSNFSPRPSRQPLEVIEWESNDHRPAAGTRRVGPIRAGDHVLAGLLAHIDAEEWLRASVDDLEAAPGGRATARLEELRSPPGEEVMGRLDGRVEDPGAGNRVLLVVDGTVESAAPVRPDGRFTLMLPPDVPRGPGTAVGLIQVGGAVPLELDVRSA